MTAKVEWSRHLVLSGVPMTKKNHQDIKKNVNTGKRFITQNDKYRTWEEAASWKLAAQNGALGAICEPVNVKEVFYMPTRRRVDLTNLEEAVDDALVRAGVLIDDNINIVAGHEGSHVKIDKYLPRVEITITPAEEWQIFMEG